MIEVNGEKTWVVLSRSQAFASCPEKSDIVRVDDFLQSCAMQSDGTTGSKGQSILWLSFLLARLIKIRLSIKLILTVLLSLL